MTTRVRHIERPMHRPHGGVLPVMCWCELFTVLVSPTDIKRGLTLPCESASCVKMNEEART